MKTPPQNVKAFEISGYLTVLGLAVGITFWVRFYTQIKQNLHPRKTNGWNLKINPYFMKRKLIFSPNLHCWVQNVQKIEPPFYSDECSRKESRVVEGCPQPCWKMDANSPSSANPKRCNLGAKTHKRWGYRTPTKRKKCFLKRTWC